MVAMLAACKNKTNFSINGKLENAGNAVKVYLYGMDKKGMQVLDSTTLSEKGEFKFTKSAPEADFFNVKVGENDYIFIAKNGDNINLNADMADKTLAYKISGAADADKLTELNLLKNYYGKKIEAIKQDFDNRVEQQPDDRQKITKELSPKYNQAISDLNNAILKFAQENNSSLAGFYAASLLNATGNENGLIKYAESVGPELKKNTAVAQFVERMINLKNVQIGQPAPDFTIPTIDGKTTSLKNFRGKYLLIDFWASWCAPCREENPNVVQAYNQFKNRNFTILGISLDKDKNAWEQAVKQDGLTWQHASELADFDGKIVRLYQIEAIPSSFLVDPKGKIIARDLRGDELTSFLNKTLPNN